MRDPVADLVALLVRRVAEVERRLKNVVRYGTVEEVDYKKGLVRIKDGELLSGWMPWHDVGGAIKTWTPPAKGQIAVVFAPSGEVSTGIAFAGQFSDKNPQNHDKGAEYRMTIGGTSILVTGDSVTIDVTNFTVNADKITLNADLVQATGDELKHNAKNVGDDHKHTDVVPGGGLTGVPTG